MDEPGRILMRGLDNIRGKFSLTALIYNTRSRSTSCSSARLTGVTP
jgi:hypothetical protein